MNQLPTLIQYSKTSSFTSPAIPVDGARGIVIGMTLSSGENRSGVLGAQVSVDGINFSNYNMLISNVTNVISENITRVASITRATDGTDVLSFSESMWKSIKLVFTMTAGSHSASVSPSVSLSSSKSPSVSPSASLSSSASPSVSPSVSLSPSVSPSPSPSVSLSPSVSPSPSSRSSISPSLSPSLSPSQSLSSSASPSLSPSLSPSVSPSVSPSPSAGSVGGVFSLSCLVTF